MTRGTRHSAPSPEFSSDSSSITDKRTRKHHRRINKEKLYYDSTEQSPYDDAEEESEYTDDESAAGGTNAPAPLESGKSLRRTSSSLRSSLIGPLTESSYLNIAPLPIFRGSPGECPTAHLSRFSKVCRANNASSVEMMTRIFPVTLDGEAALWYDLNIEPYSSLSWEEIKTLFLQAYYGIGVREELRSELMMINQEGEESVRSYFLRLQWILHKWPDHGLPDGLVEGIFVDGLRKELKDWVVPQKPSSLNEALRLAFEWEKVKSIRRGASHEEAIIRERMKRLWMKTNKFSSKYYSGRIGSSGEEEFESWGDRSTFNDIVGKGDDEEGEEEEEGMAAADTWKKKKKTQCQCWKHQCSKKRLERNTSLLTAKNSTSG